MKTNNDKLPKNHPYSADKFYCPCCRTISDQYKSIEKFQRLLMAITKKTNKYYTITSAFRCLTQNKKVGGAEKSDHLSMLAIDIAMISAIERYAFLKYLLASKTKFRYIEVAPNYIHISLESPVANAFDRLEPILALRGAK